MAGKRLAAFTVFALLALALALFATADSHAGSYSFSPPDGWTGTGPILPMSVAAQVDSDNDGFSDIIETYLGTDPLDNCPDGPGDDAWPLDHDMDTLVNVIGDVFTYIGKIGYLDIDPEWDAALQRFDLNADGAISGVFDTWRFYGGMIMASCNGGTPHPPPVSEGTPVTMGIDPEITGNSPITLGDLEECVRVNVDTEDFNDGIADHTIDVYVTGAVEAPTGYDAWVTYYSDRVDPISWNDLIKLPGAGSFTNEIGSRLNAGAAYFGPGTGIAGDGTILRIDLDVKSSGYACFGFGFAKAYSSVDVIHPTVPMAASLAINADCATDDSDGDGVIDMCDTCRDIWNPGQEDYDGDRWGEECDNCPTIPTKWYVPLGDEDCDGFSTTVEQYLGTDPADNCPDWPGTPGLCPGPDCDGHDVWPLDNTVDTEIDTTGDVWSYVGKIGATGGSPDTPECPGPLSGAWSQRLDLDHSCDIDVTGDVWMFVGMVGEDCDAP